MKLMTFEYFKSRQRNSSRLLKKQNDSKKLEYRLELELTERLKCLEENDRVLFEIAPNVLSEFLNILDSRFSDLYHYEQIEKNKFLFYNKEISLNDI